MIIRSVPLTRFFWPSIGYCAGIKYFAALPALIIIKHKLPVLSFEQSPTSIDIFLVINQAQHGQIADVCFNSADNSYYIIKSKEQLKN
jgi:hypothetical protein